MVKGEGALTAEDWAEAALRALVRSGMSAVAVEPLARELGATKGSFYWHFRNRAELVEAVLDLWERRYVVEAVAGLSEIADPRERLDRLFTVAVTPGAGRIDVALADAAQGNPALAERVRRVHEQRVAFLAALYEELGLPAVEAHSLSVLALVAQAGLAVVQVTAPDLVSDPAQVAALQGLLVPER